MCIKARVLLFIRFRSTAFLLIFNDTTTEKREEDNPFSLVYIIKKGVVALFPPLKTSSKFWVRRSRCAFVITEPYTRSDFRPFLRRLCNTRRPPGVAERLRNPWLRARFFFFGWYVRFGMVLLFFLYYLFLLILSILRHSMCSHGIFREKFEYPKNNKFPEKINCVV